MRALDNAMQLGDNKGYERVQTGCRGGGSYGKEVTLSLIHISGEGLADGESIVITRDVEADKQDDVVYVLEFTTEDGSTQSFDTLHYEVAPISLKSVDAAAGATAIAFEAPQRCV